VKVTTFAPDEEYRKRIQASANNIELESISSVEEIGIPSPPTSSFPKVEVLTSEIPETSSKPPHKILTHLKSNDIVVKKKAKKPPHYNSHDYDYSNDDDGKETLTRRETYE
jgi:hypothetical protein